MIEFKGDSLKRENVTFPGGASSLVTFKDVGGQRIGNILEIGAVYFCNPAEFPIDCIQLRPSQNSCITADQVQKVQGRLYLGNPVYKATFDKPVEYFPANKGCNWWLEIHFKTKKYSGVGTGAIISGNIHQTFTIDGKEMNTELTNGPDDSSWHFLVGLSIKLKA